MQTNLLVIDSSVAVKWLSEENERYIIQADKILTETKEKTTKLFMPELSKYEVANALINKRIILEEGKKCLTIFYSLPIEYITSSFELEQLSMEITYRHKITFYDASFIALAKTYRAVLITDNPKHQKIRENGVKIIELKDY